jgi:hypothetical protein
MIMECTDCKWCANFSDGFRIFCLNEKLPSDEVCKYQPLADRDADNCKEFREWSSVDFSWDDFTAAEKWSEEKYSDITYESIREWCEMKIKEKTTKG